MIEVDDDKALESRPHLPLECLKGAWEQSDTTSRAVGSLKGLLEAATGLPASRMKLVFGRVGRLDDDERTLCSYGIGHGASLSLSVGPEPGAKKDVCFLAGPRLASDQGEDVFCTVRKFMRSKVGGVKGNELVEALPGWVRPVPAGSKGVQDLVEPEHEQAYRDYTDMHDNGIFDNVSLVRKRFGSIQRTSQAMSAAQHLQAYAAAAAYRAPFSAR
jgi:hypothetical protein